MYKFAIIGCGHISFRHAEIILTQGQLVAVCDIDSEKAEALARQYNCKAYDSIDSLLIQEKDVDIVCVCTPNGFHAEHVIKSLQAGKHVLCENPLCITSAAAWQIIETEKFSGKKLFIVDSSRYTPLLQNLKKLLAKNLLGNIYSFQLNCFFNRPVEYYAGWRGKKFPGGGILYTDLSYYIDVVHWLFGDFSEVKGFIVNAAHQGLIEFEDTGVAALKMQNNALGTINWSVNSFEKNSETGLTIIAEKGIVCLGGESLNLLKYHHLQKPHSTQSVDDIPNDFNSDEAALSNYKKIYLHLLKTIGSTSRFSINSLEGLKTVETIERIYKAVNYSLLT